jgi:hypothetical protein
MRHTTLAIALVFCAAVSTASEAWAPLFNGTNLDGWESVGDGVWTVLNDGTLVGQRNPKNLSMLKPWPGSLDAFHVWLYTQAWLYTKHEFTEYDLRLDYWARRGGNSGVSIRDPSRAKHAVAYPPEFTRTPSRIGYEIQISNQYDDGYPTGSIYLFAKAKPGVQIDDQWNTLEIESRRDRIRVKLNGQVVAEHPGDPARPKAGPVGLQLHDQFSVMMFRNIRIREVGGGR